MKSRDRITRTNDRSGNNKTDSKQASAEIYSANPPDLAKISPPLIGKIYSRTQLIKKLYQARQHRIVWICAPAGAGKTTLVADYIASHNIDCLWYQMDTGDADPANFFHYLKLAVDARTSNPGACLPHFTPEYQQNPSIFTRHYFEKLFSRLNTPAMMVFDSFQRLSPGAPLQQLLSDMVTVIPQGVQLVIVSRDEPPTWFARLKAQQAATVLEAKDLQITEEESIGIARLFHKETHHGFSDAAIRSIHGHTKGWAAGLILALQALEKEDINTVLEDGTAQEDIFDYFANELFDKADPEEQAFLLKSALLPRMPLSLVEEFTGYFNSKRILNGLYNRNFFLTRRAGAAPVYEYHPLFRDFLLERGIATWEAHWLHELRRQASQILLASKEIEAAIDLLLMVKDWEQATESILAVSEKLINQGRNRALKGWLNQLPEEFINNTPWLLYWLGACHDGVDIAAAERCFEQAYQLFETTQDATGSFLTLAEAIQLAWVTQQDYRVIDKWLKRFGTLRQRYPHYPSLKIEARVITSVLMAMYIYRPEHSQSVELLKRAEWFWNTELNANLRWQIGSALGYALLGSGNLPKWINSIRQFEPARKDPRFTPIERLFMLMSIALDDCYSGAYESSLEHVKHALLLSEKTGIHLFNFWIISAGIYSSLIQEKLETADNYLEKMRSSLTKRSSNLGRAHYLILVCWRALIEENHPRALQDAQLALELMESHRGIYPVALGHYCLAHALFESEDIVQAREILKKIRIHWGEKRHEHMQYQYDFTQAYFYSKEGDLPTTEKYLKKALRRGQDQNYGLPLLSRPKLIEPLLNLALKHQIETAYVVRLIQQAKITPQNPTALSEEWPLPIRIYTLGRFLLQINGKTLSLSVRSKNRPLDLLKLLVAFGGQDIAEAKVMDILWPDAAGDAARRSLNTTLHRLRKLLGMEAAIILKDGRITLDPRYFWVDAWVLEHVLRLINLKLSENRPDGKTIEQLSRKTRELYRGSFLSNDSAQPWSLLITERLRNHIIRAYLALGDFWEKQSDWNHAINAYQEGIEIDYLIEVFYQRLMSIHDNHGRFAEALATYEQCRKALSTTLGVMPNQETVEIYLAIQAHAKESFNKYETELKTPNLQENS